MAVVGWLLGLTVLLLALFTVGWGVYAFIKKPEPLAVLGAPPPREMLLYVAFVAFLACSAMSLLFTWVGFEQTTWGTLEQSLRSIFPTSIDADHYLKIAEYGYGTGEAFFEQYLMIVFFPLFPWLVRALQAITGLGFYTVGTFVQPWLFATGATSFFYLVYRRFGKQTAWWAFVFLLAMPGAFFFAIPMTESLFLALVMLAFVFLDADNVYAFAAFGFLAALTRPTGGLLAGVAGIAFLLSVRRGKVLWKWLCAAIAPVGGFLVYLGINWRVYGDFFAYATYQKDHWGNSLGFVWKTVEYHWGYLFWWWESNNKFAIYVSLFTVASILIQIALFALCAKKLPLAWLGYAVASWLVANGATWLISAPRYAVTLAFVPLCFALSCKNRFARTALLAAMLLVSALYLRQYFKWGPIY